MGIIDYIVLGCFLIIGVIIMVGCALDCCGYYDKKQENPYMDNSEYDYGHNVNHKEE